MFNTSKALAENQGQEVAQQNMLDNTAILMDKARTENINSSVFNGDIDGVRNQLDTKDVVTTPEQLFVSLVAGEGVDIEKIVKYATQLRGNNQIQDMIAKAEGDKIWFVSTFASILNNVFLPGHSARVDNEVIGNALNIELGFFEKSVASVDLMNELKDYYNVLGEDDKGIFLENLYNSVKETSGTVFDNPEEVASFFRKFQDYTASDASINNFFSVLDTVAYPVGIFAAMFKSAAKNGNAALANELANRELAATGLAKDILEGTSVSGVAPAEHLSSAFKAGKSPYTADGELLAGAEESIKKALADQAASREVQTIMDMAGPTGIDVKEYQHLVDKYDKLYKDAASPEIHSMSFKDVDDLGITYDIFYGDANLGGFLTKEHAERFAQKNGLKDFELITTDEGNYLLKGEYKHTFTINDNMPYDLDLKQATQHLYQFLHFPLQTIDSSAVNTRVIGVHQEDTARVAFEKLFKDAEKGLTARSNAKVEQVLKLGNDSGEVFKPDYLSLHLTPKEQASYYQKVSLRDISHVAHDKAIVDRLTFLGFKEVRYTGKHLDEQQMAGKVLTEAEATGFTGKSKIVTHVTNEGTQQLEMSGALIKEAYKKGERLVRTQDGKVLLIKESELQVKELDTVLPYRAGEQSRMYSDRYFTTMEFKGTRDGVEKMITNTMRTAPTHKAAEAWAKGMNEAMRILRDAASKNGAGLTSKELMRAMSKHVDNPMEIIEAVKKKEIPLDAEFSTKFDRESVQGTNTHTDSAIETAFNTGKLFTGKRGDSLKNVFGESAAIKSPKESIAKELSYVSRFINSATWRESQIDKLLKTFEGKLVPIEGGTKYENAMSAPLKTNVGTREQKYLKTLRNHIRVQLGVPSESALKHAARMREFARILEGVPRVGDWMSNKALDFAHGTVTQSLRTAVFHSYLGLANTQQFFVQANGAFVAAAIHPVYGALAAKNAMSLRIGLIFDSVGNEGSLRELAKITSALDAGITNVDEFLDTVKFIRETGILNGMKSSALHYVAEGAVNLETHLAAYTGGLKSATRKTFSTALKLGLAPFNRGEELARITSLDIARREWMKANPGKSFLTRGAKNAILARQETLTLGMSRANVGRMQEGLIAIPFQFAHYNWKLMESLLGKQFTVQEKASILPVAALLYGAEGVGLTALVDSLLPDGVIDSLTETQKLYIAEGIISGAIYQVSGTKTAVGSRVGPGGYFAKNIKAFTSEDLSFLAALAGPSGTFGIKEWEAAKEMLRLYNVDDIDLGEGLVEAFHIAFKGASSGYSNITKYAHALWGDGYLRSKAGQKIAQVSSLEAILALAGMGSYKEVMTYKAQDILKNTGRIKADLSKGLSSLFDRYISADSQSDRDFIYKLVVAYQQTIPEAILLDVLNTAHNTVTSSTKYDQNMNRLYISILKGHTDKTILTPN